MLYKLAFQGWSLTQFSCLGLYPWLIPSWGRPFKYSPPNHCMYR